jgi:protoporphyrinogen oxidase
MANPDVAIVGAGLAGLTCALELHRAGVGCAVYEASDGVGGRVRTDRVDGFLLDRGFQVLLTAYPQVRRLVELDALRLRPFYPGARIRLGGRFHRLADPFRRPLDGVLSLLNPVGTPLDKLRVARVRARVRRGSPYHVFERPERTTAEALRADGFSPRMVDAFFRPFLGGIYLEPELRSTSRMYEFVMRMMASDDIAVPADGMGALPAWIAAQLPPGTVRLEHPIENLDELGARQVVVATEGPAAARLLGAAVDDPGSHDTCCVYLAAPAPPLPGPLLTLDGEGRGPAINVTAMSEVAPEYAPAGRTLVSAAVVGEAAKMDDVELLRAVRRQMRDWFGAQAEEWEHLRTYRIPHALPAAPQRSLSPPQRPVHIAPGRWVCGDHRDNASIDGAMASGRRTAEALLREIGAR